MKSGAEIFPLGVSASRSVGKFPVLIVFDLNVSCCQVAVLLVAVAAPALSAPAPEPAPEPAPAPKPSGGVLLVNQAIPASTVVVGPGGGIVSTSGLVPISTLVAGHPGLVGPQLVWV